MSVIPNIETCLICDLIRPELGGKLIVLGFMGICPHVEIGVPRLDEPTVLTFLFAGGPGEGSHVTSFEVVDEIGQRVVGTTAPVESPFNSRVRTNLATTMMLTFGHAGTFFIRCRIDDQERFRAQFTVITPRDAGP